MHRPELYRRDTLKTVDFPDLVQPLLEGRDLLEDAALDLMRRTMSGELTASQVGAYLSLIRVKGATMVELAAFATVLREHAIPVPVSPEEADDLVDTCGTGGGAPSFNLSTAAMFVAAGAGLKIAKHGNRGVTSKCGSADVLEALGVKLLDAPDSVAQCLRNCQIAFMLAPAFHPGMKVVGPLRRELGFRTVFNQLGPLLNPARAPRQLIGVYDSALVLPMAQALGRLGTDRSVVVHSAAGLDEVSPVGPTRYACVHDRTVIVGEWSPKSFGMDPVPESALAGGQSAAENAAILTEAISDPKSLRCSAIIPNAAAALWVGKFSHEIGECADAARASVSSGAARAKLDQFIEESNR